MSGQYSAGTNVTLLALDGPPTDSWTNAQIQTDLTFHEPRTAPSGSLSTRLVAAVSFDLVPYRHSPRPSYHRRLPHLDLRASRHL